MANELCWPAISTAHVILPYSPAAPFLILYYPEAVGLSSYYYSIPQVLGCLLCCVHSIRNV